jgi:hypothetical protein
MFSTRGIALCSVLVLLAGCAPGPSEVGPASGS